MVWRFRGGISIGFTMMVTSCLLVAAPAEATPPECTTSIITAVGTTSCVVPLGIESIDVNIYGARGGASSNGPGAFGALVTTTLHVSPGETLTINVGGIGGSATASGAAGGFNGGGAGGTYDNTGAGGGTGGGGGGASDIRIGGVADVNRVIVAGGGGGQGYGSAGGTGGQVGADGAGGSSQGGLGATQSAVGAGGASGGNAGVGSTGGAGALSTLACCGYFYGGAGGGGGWFGGGGSGAAANTSFSAGGGGGGSSNAVATGGRTSSTTYYSGADASNSGNGKVALTLASTISYSVTYVGNGNSTGSVPVDGNSYLSGSPVTVLGNTGNLTKSGYQFMGWEVSPTPPSGNAFPSVGGNFTILANSTLTARWGGGPLEFRSSPSLAPTSSIAFSPVAIGQNSVLTVYVRNIGNVAVNVSNVTPNGSGVSLTGGTCSSGGGAIQPYNNGTIADCTYTFTWTASASLSYPFSVNYFAPNSVTLTGTPLNPARTPMLDAPVRTATGYAVNVTNYDALWNWAPSVTTGTGVVTPGTPTATTLPLTVTGVAPGASVTITVNSTRSGYVSGTATKVGTALNAALTPTFDTPVSTADGYTVNVTNYDALWTWLPTVNHGTVTAGTVSGVSMPLRVTGLTPGSSAEITVVTSQSTHADGSGTVTGKSISTPDPKPNPDPDPTPAPTPQSVEKRFELPQQIAAGTTTTIIKVGAKTNQGQPIKGRARCLTVDATLVPVGDVRAQCRVWTSKNGALKVWTSGRVPVRVHAVQTAAGTSTLAAYRVSKMYRVGVAVS